jgi:hypothetical protein
MRLTYRPVRSGPHHTDARGSLFEFETLLGVAQRRSMKLRRISLAAYMGGGSKRLVGGLPKATGILPQSEDAMDVAAESLLLIALLSAFLAAIAALVLLRPKTDRAANYFSSLRGFVFLASILSLVCVVLYMTAQHEVGGRSASSTAARQPATFVQT